MDKVAMYKEEIYKEAGFLKNLSGKRLRDAKKFVTRHELQEAGAEKLPIGKAFDAASKSKSAKRRVGDARRATILARAGIAGAGIGTGAAIAHNKNKKEA